MEICKRYKLSRIIEVILQIKGVELFEILLYLIGIELLVINNYEKLILIFYLRLLYS